MILIWITGIFLFIIWAILGSYSNTILNYFYKEYLDKFKDFLDKTEGADNNFFRNLMYIFYWADFFNLNFLRIIVWSIFLITFFILEPSLNNIFSTDFWTWYSLLTISIWLLSLLAIYWMKVFLLLDRAIIFLFFLWIAWSLIYSINPLIILISITGYVFLYILNIIIKNITLKNWLLILGKNDLLVAGILWLLLPMIITILPWNTKIFILNNPIYYINFLITFLFITFILSVLLFSLFFIFTKKNKSQRKKYYI